MQRSQGTTSMLSLVTSDADGRSANAGFDVYDDERDNDRRLHGIADASDYIVDIREFDVPYHVRVAIDKGTTIKEQ